MVLDAANLKKAMRHLAKVDPDFARVLKEVGHPELREMPTGFGGLMRSIVGQQVSVHAARSIWLRLEAAAPSMEPIASRPPRLSRHSRADGERAFQRTTAAKSTRFPAR